MPWMSSVSSRGCPGGVRRRGGVKGRREERQKGVGWVCLWKGAPWYFEGNGVCGRSVGRSGGRRRVAVRQ